VPVLPAGLVDLVLFCGLGSLLPTKDFLQFCGGALILPAMISALSRPWTGRNEHEIPVLE